MAINGTDKDNNFLIDLIDAGNDAHGNLYELEFSNGIFDGASVTGVNTTTMNLGQALAIRTPSFTPPQVRQDNYTVKYITAFVDWPKAKADVTRNFSLEFRVDANWEVYKKLQEQKNKMFIASQSYASTHVKDAFIVKVFALQTLTDAEGSDDVQNKQSPYGSQYGQNRVQLYQFEDCWVSKIDSPKFTTGNSDSIKVQVTINFEKMYDLETGMPS